MTKFMSSKQWASGEFVASFLDSHFRKRGWIIEPTTREEERVSCLGDRHYRRSEKHFYVEYKSGIQTFYTGNIFLETISVDSENIPGWIYTCQADYIFYAALLNHKILIFKPTHLRDITASLKKKFRTAKTSKGQNTGYNTHGILVPLEYAEKQIAHQVISIEFDITEWNMN